VRAEIIPFLEKYNPRLKRVLFNLSEHLREDFEFIAEYKMKNKKLIREGDASGISIKLKDIIIQPRALQKEILRDCLSRANGDLKRLTFRHWKEMENFLKHNRTGDSLDLPGSIRLSRTADELEFRKI
jgi:tRNA(Ile)-lysidine synthase